MTRSMRSAAASEGTPSRNSRSVADSAAALPASGHSETDLATLKPLPSRVRLTRRRAGHSSQVNQNRARPRAGFSGIGRQYPRIRTLLVRGAGWLARQLWSPANGSRAGSASHRGSGMYLEDVVHNSPEALAGGGVRVDSRRAASHSAVRPADTGAVRVGQAAANFLGRGCARLGERIRASSGVAVGDAASDQRAAGTPWLRLMLWFFACAGLFVSLIMQPHDLERDHRVAARSSAQPQIEDHPYRAPSLTGQASEFSLIAPPHLPPRWAAD